MSKKLDENQSMQVIMGARAIAAMAGVKEETVGALLMEYGTEEELRGIKDADDGFAAFQVCQKRFVEEVRQQAHAKGLFAPKIDGSAFAELQKLAKGGGEVSEEAATEVAEALIARTKRKAFDPS